MTIQKQKNKLFLIFGVSALFLCAALFPSLGSAQNGGVKCLFTDNLEVGIINEEVRCLQKYLNAAGFQVAETGVGSPGNETSIFREHTKEAVKKWQTAHGISPTGIFGPLSKAKYEEEFLLKPTPSVYPSISPTPSISVTPTPSPKPSGEAAARAKVVEARDGIDDAVDDMESAEKAGKSIGKAKTYIKEARAELLLALYDFIDADYKGAIKNANDTIDSTKLALGEFKNTNKQGTANKAVKAAEDKVASARLAIREAENAGKDVDDAMDYLGDAKRILKDAQNAYEDKEYGDAIRYAKDAEKFAKEAQSAIRN